MLLPVRLIIYGKNVLTACSGGQVMQLGQLGAGQQLSTCMVKLRY
jgi:hypothetical protein